MLLLHPTSESVGAHDGRSLRATRPHYFFRREGTMPSSVTLARTIPPELGPIHDVRRAVQEGVEAIERDQAEQRRISGKRVVGRRRLLEQSWCESPSTIAPRFTLRPRFAARNSESRIARLLQYREFLSDYRAARCHLLAGVQAPFPFGTYWLRHFASVAVTATDS